MIVSWDVRWSDGMGWEIGFITLRAGGWIFNLFLSLHVVKHLELQIFCTKGAIEIKFEFELLEAGTFKVLQFKWAMACL